MTIHLRTLGDFACSFESDEKADRTLVRSAISAHRRPINISIRAKKFGELTRAKQKKVIQAIDIWLNRSILIVIKWPAMGNIMTAAEVIAIIEFHRRKCPGSLRWFAGIYIAPRIHPWDEQEHPFPTKAWIGITIATSEEAQTIVQKLFQLGYGESPINTNKSSAKHIFAYAMNKESLN